MNGFCDWCEEIASQKRGDDDICDACIAKLERERDAEEAADERAMPLSERMAWMRARDAGVD